MIFSSIKNLSENDFGQKYMACAAEFLATHNLDELPLGKTEIDGDKVYTDSNHPFSGRNLLFEVEVADVREATDEELDHGHVHEYENEE